MPEQRNRYNPSDPTAFLPSISLSLTVLSVQGADSATVETQVAGVIISRLPVLTWGVSSITTALTHVYSTNSQIYSAGAFHSGAFTIVARRSVSLSGDVEAL
jgi:hypothetical protein